MMSSFVDICWLLIAIIGLIVIFNSVCIVVDSHLVPAVEVIIEEFSVPEEIAAVTLIAFGSSAPEILLNTVSAVNNASSLSMPALLGSAIIAFGFIPPLCVLYQEKADISLDTGPIIRETLFFLFGLLLFMQIISDGVSSTKEALELLSIYVFYVSFVVGAYCLKLRYGGVENSTPPKNDEESTNFLAEYSSGSGVIELPPLEISVQGVEPSTATSTRADILHRLSGYYEKVSIPLKWWLANTIPPLRPSGALTPTHPVLANEARVRTPRGMDAMRRGNSTVYSCGNDDPSSLGSPGSPLRMREPETHVSPGGTELPVLHACHPERYARCIARRESAHSCGHPVMIGVESVIGVAHTSLCRSLACIAVCIIYICVFSSLIVETCDIIVSHMGMSQTTVGGTLVAFGAQIPDIVSAMVLSRDGYYDGAMACATGSQVINITLGTGLPAFVMCLYGNGKFKVENQETSLTLLVFLVLVIIAGYVWLASPALSLPTRSCSVPKVTKMTRIGAYHQLIIFAASIVTYITLNE